MKKGMAFTILLFVIYAGPSFGQQASPIADTVAANKEIDSLNRNYIMDKNRAMLIQIEKDNPEIVGGTFSNLSPEIQASVTKNRLQQALRSPLLTMNQKRIIVWTMKKIKASSYDDKNAKRNEEVTALLGEIMPVISHYFTEAQICLLYTAECTLKGIE